MTGQTIVVDGGVTTRGRVFASPLAGEVAASGGGSAANAPR